MNGTYRQIVRHASIFGAGAILFRLASIVLLPVYTRYLNPSDYGVMALLDLTINVLTVVAAAGVASSATRAHFEDGVSQGRVWWTAVLCEMALATVVIGPAVVLRSHLATFVFGPVVPDGARYFGLGLSTLWIGSVMTIVDAFFRARKASSFVVAVGVFRLIVNISLNVALLIHWQMGVEGILWGNLISAAAALIVQFVPFIAVNRQIGFDWATARTYWRFGWPLTIFGLFSLAMHEADRYILRLFVSLHDVGLYSVAYQIGQGVNTLVLVPFSSIWSVIIYEIAKRPDAKTMYAQVFKHYVFGLSLVLLLAALFAGPILNVIAPPQYAQAADIVPIVCLAYFFFSIHDHFKVPALLAGRTGVLLPAVIAAAGVNIGLNFVVIPAFGVVGAAWTSVVTFAVFASVGLMLNRRLDRYPYPLGASALTVAGMCATFGLYRAVKGIANGPGQIVLAAALWLVWCAAFLAGSAWRRMTTDWLSTGLRRSAPEAAVLAGTGSDGRDSSGSPIDRL